MKVEVSRKFPEIERCCGPRELALRLDSSLVEKFANFFEGFPEFSEKLSVLPRTINFVILQILRCNSYSEIYYQIYYLIVPDCLKNIITQIINNWNKFRTLIKQQE